LILISRGTETVRYIAIFLLLANVGYFAWNYKYPRPQLMAEEPRALLNTGLTLLSEYEAQGDELALDSVRQCSIVSGFRDRSQAEAFMTTARARNLLAYLEAEAPQAEFRVYLPPTPSRDIAAAILDDLSERLMGEDLGLDVYLITRGELENAIALGLFGSREQAEAAQDQVAGLGYGPQIEEIPLGETRIRVFLRPVESERIIESEWLDLSAETEGLTRLENLCEGLVQAPQFQ
jgi:hypothetical protein